MMTISDEAKERVNAVLKPGDLAVDATMGNGWDTFFLAEKIGQKGRVFAFDVQEEALNATRKRLRKKNLLERCELHLRGHEEMAEVVPDGVGAAMFNLGYLPYAKREVVTRGETTLKALQAALALLRKGGVVTVICYRGHPGGERESCEVWHWAQSQKEMFEVEGPERLSAGSEPFLVTLGVR